MLFLWPGFEILQRIFVCTGLEKALVDAAGSRDFLAKALRHLL